MAKKKVYDNDSISSLKGADRVRKRPGVIFGSDGLEGCEHAVFEIDHPGRQSRGRPDGLLPRNAEGYGPAHALI